MTEAKNDTANTSKEQDTVCFNMVMTINSVMQAPSEDVGQCLSTVLPTLQLYFSTSTIKGRILHQTGMES